MPRRFELLVFDWDGTLMDSAPAIVASLQAACADLTLPVPDAARARYVIGLGLQEALEYILPGLESERRAQVVERYRWHFLQRDGATALFPGAAQTVRELRAAGFKLAVATGKSRRGLERALRATGLESCFHGTRCADEGSSKPHPGMLEYLMQALGADRRRTLMIGDTTHDMEMARNAAVASLAVAYGAHEEASLLRYAPLACAREFAELREWLHRHA